MTALILGFAGKVLRRYPTALSPRRVRTGDLSVAQAIPLAVCESTGHAPSRGKCRAGRC